MKSNVKRNLTSKTTIFDLQYFFERRKYDVKKLNALRRVVPLTTLLDRTADIFFLISALQYECRAQLRELGSDMGTRHLLQVGRSAEGRLHSYVDHNRAVAIAFTSLPEAPREAQGHV